MRQDDTFDDGLTSDELAALRNLAAERIPPAELKARAVRALTDAGRLRAPRRITPRLMLAFSAAASVVFIAGAALGYMAGMRRVQNSPATVAPAPSRAVARAVPSDSTARATRQVVWF